MVRTPHILLPVLLLALLCAVAFPADTIAPRVELLEPARGTVITTNLVRFKARITDSGSGIARAGFMLRYFDYLDTTEDRRKVDTIAILHAPPWECIFDMRTLPDQDMWRLVPAVWAYDSAGNYAYDRSLYMVLDRTPDTSSRVTKARYLSRPVTIDGDLAEWAAPADSFENGNNTVLFRLAWDQDNLYAAVWVRDSDVVPAGEASPWLFDDVELFFDTRHDRSSIRQSDDKQIIVTPRGRIRPWLVDIEADTQYVWSKRVRAAADTMGGKEGNGYRIELAIPWRELIDDASAATRMRMGFDLFNSDRDGRHSYRTGFSWAQNPRHNNSNPSQWGTLVLRRLHETPAWPAAIPLLMAAAAVVFWSFYRSRPEKAPAAGMSREKAPITSEKIVADARAYIEEHFTDESLRLADVARGLGLNANYLSGVFKKTAGVSFPRYLNGVRVREAKRLLRTTSSAVSDIALAAGFSSSNALQRAFRQLENTSPREYRRKATAS